MGTMHMIRRLLFATEVVMFRLFFKAVVVHVSQKRREREKGRGSELRYTSRSQAAYVNQKALLGLALSQRQQVQGWVLELAASRLAL